MQALSGLYEPVGIVVIGRNEGHRLLRCLASLSTYGCSVYVDSESDDSSVRDALALGTAVVALKAPPVLTAARGRNAGVAYLTSNFSELRFIQMIDGDCEMDAGWLRAGMDALAADPGLGLVFGRRRERFPQRSIYNQLCDDEWNVDVGEALTCGGDVLCRVEALQQIGGYDETMIAGEDPDMAVRMRAAGWRLQRIDAEMTLHDAAITRFAQWWRRSERAGHAFAELADRHKGSVAPDWRRQCRSIIAWGAVLPLLTILAICATGSTLWAWVAVASLLALWPLKILQVGMTLRKRLPLPFALTRSAFLMLGKLPECLGLLRFQCAALSGRRSALIEYKGVEAR